MATDHKDIERKRAQFRAEQAESIRLEKEGKRTRDAVKQWNGQGVPLAVDLNSRFNEKIRFNSDLQKLTKHLNEFTLGKSFIKGKKRLKIKACFEEGANQSNLHCHMIISDLDQTRRTLSEIKAFIKKEWAKIIGINNPNGNMVNAEVIKNSKTHKRKNSYLVKFLNSRRALQGEYMLL